MKLITLHLPVPYIKALDRLVNSQMYPNRAEAIRLFIRDGLNSEARIVDQDELQLQDEMNEPWVKAWEDATKPEN